MDLTKAPTSLDKFYRRRTVEVHPDVAHRNESFNFDLFSAHGTGDATSFGQGGMTMRKLLALFVCLGLAFGVVAAQQDPSRSSPQEQPASPSFAGLLLDAACKASQPSAECGVSAGTSSFGILTSDGKFLKFDANGNALAKSEIGKSEKTGKVSVSVTGTLDGSETIRVESFAVN